MENFIKLSSMTEAMKCKRLLQRYGIFSQIKRITNKQTGCSVGIYVVRNIDMAIEILMRNHIYPQGQVVGDDI